MLPESYNAGWQTCSSKSLAGWSDPSSSNSWMSVLRPSMTHPTPHLPTAQALAYLHITGKQLTSPSGSSCCWKCSSSTCCRDPGSCFTVKLEGTTAAPNTESRAVTSAKAEKAANSCCWLKYRVRLLLPWRIVGGSCCTEAGSKWYLAARQNFSPVAPFPFLTRQNAAVKSIQITILSLAASSWRT